MTDSDTQASNSPDQLNTYMHKGPFIINYLGAANWPWQYTKKLRPPLRRYPKKKQPPYDNTLKKKGPPFDSYITYSTFLENRTYYEGFLDG